MESAVMFGIKMANNLTVEGTRAMAGAVRHIISVDETY
jgi:hypothetical protein